MKEKAIPCRRISDTPGCIALLKYGNYLYAAGNDVFSVYAVYGRHQLAVRVKRNLRQARIFFVQLVFRHAVAMGGKHDGGFRRIADVLFFRAVEDDGAVAAQGAVLQKTPDFR